MSIALDRVPLSELLAANQQDHLEPVVPFAAFRDEIPVIVVAVLERTAAYHAIGDRYDTGVIRLDRCFVDPSTVEWKAKPGDVENGHKKPGRAYRNYRTNAQPADEARVASDVRAIANRQQVQRQTELEHAQLAAQRIKPAVADQAEEKAKMPTGTLSETVRATPKTCRICGNEKPREEFPKTGSNAFRCFECASAAASAPAPIKRSVKAKTGKRRAASRLAAIPAESPSVNGVADNLVNQIRLLINKREGLRAQLDKVQGELRELVSA